MPYSKVAKPTAVASEQKVVIQRSVKAEKLMNEYLESLKGLNIGYSICTINIEEIVVVVDKAKFGNVNYANNLAKYVNENIAKKI